MKQIRFQAEPDINKLKEFSIQLRRDTARMIHYAGAGHIGGALGIADFIAALYGWGMEFDSENLDDPERDRIVLSNGHTCAVWYAALARCGYFPMEELNTFRQLGTRLQGHPARRSLPGIVETSTGPLGQGLSVANGIALSMKKRKSRGQVYCVVGDGEMQEGQIWEALLTAAHYKLNNMTIFINYNNLQIDGKLQDVIALDDMDKRLSSFGWNVISIDGHSMEEIAEALKKGRSSERPTAILAETLMAKGVPFMEDQAKWHGTCPSSEELTAALDAIGESEIFSDYPLV